MAKIKLLSKETIDKIAAGEVVVNAAGAIKELIENSLDAGARSITIETQNGGKSRICVIDDGCGIDNADIPLVFVRNATSKIDDDLSDIETLGFRGEALASISFVSRITLTTKTAEAEVGTKASVLKNEVTEAEAVACRVGTKIEITDLFYNTPARLKYLKKDSVETAAIIETVGTMALSRPDVRFVLTCDSREIFATDGHGDVISTAARIYGKTRLSGMMKCEIIDEPLVVSGFITAAAYSDERNPLRLIYVNSRFVKSEQLDSAVLSVYHELFSKSGAGYILYITLPIGMLDVNIHPAKTEIKLYNASLITMLIKQGIRNVLREENIIKNSAPKNVGSEESAFAAPEFAAQVFEAAKEYIVDLPKPASVSEYVPTEEAECLEAAQTLSPAPLPVQAEKPPARVDSRDILLKLAKMKYIGNAFSQYALIECGSELYAIDIHAAHERVLYDKYLKDYLSGRVASQPLLVPVMLHIGGAQHARALENLEAFSALGFELDDFGGGTLAVRSLPSELADGNIEQIVISMLDELADRTVEDISRRNERLIREACHHAVRGEADINEAQIKALLVALYDTDMPFTCPHGRSILGRLEMKYFMKAFDRI